MPALRNASEWPLWCHRLGRRINSGEVVKISAADAAFFEDNNIFVVERTTAPKRETVKRGAKQVEVTKPPGLTTRG